MVFYSSRNLHPISNERSRAGSIQQPCSHSNLLARIINALILKDYAPAVNVPMKTFQQAQVTTTAFIIPPRSQSQVEGKLNKSAVEPPVTRVAPQPHRLNYVLKTANPVRVHPLISKSAAFHTVARTANVPRNVPVVPVHKVENTKTIAKSTKPVMPTTVFVKKVPAVPSHAPLKPLDRTIAHAHNITLGMPLRRPVSNASSKKEEMEAGNPQKRRSVEAAKAGEYFANILRAYPIDNTKVPKFK